MTSGNRQSKQHHQNDCGHFETHVQSPGNQGYLKSKSSEPSQSSDSSWPALGEWFSLALVCQKPATGVHALIRWARNSLKPEPQAVEFTGVFLYYLISPRKSCNILILKIYFTQAITLPEKTYYHQGRRHSTPPHPRHRQYPVHL